MIAGISLYHTNVCSTAYIDDRFHFNLLFEVKIRMKWWLMAELCSPLGEPQYGWGSMLLHFPATTVLTLAAKYVTSFIDFTFAEWEEEEMCQPFLSYSNNNITS